MRCSPAPTALAVLAIAGCGANAPAPTPGSAAAVRATLELDRPPGGSPDGGTVGGHRGGGYEAAVEGTTLAFAGRVRPADAAIAVAGAPGAVARAAGGRFVVRLRGLGRRTVVRVTARAPGHRPWTEAVTVTRTAAAAALRREPQGVEPNRGPPGNAEATGGRVDLDARDFAFSPRRLRVRVGQQLVWRGQDAADHALRSRSGPRGAALPRSGRLGRGDRYDLTILRAGTYRYGCAIHPWMRGEVLATS